MVEVSGVVIVILVLTGIFEIKHLWGHGHAVLYSLVVNDLQ